jgi:regulator of replication initiation timing
MIPTQLEEAINKLLDIKLENDKLRKELDTTTITSYQNKLIYNESIIMSEKSNDLIKQKLTNLSLKLQSTN